MGKTAVCCALIIANPAAVHDEKPKPATREVKADERKPDPSVGSSSSFVGRERRFQTTVVLCNNSTQACSTSGGSLPAMHLRMPQPAALHFECAPPSRSTALVQQWVDELKEFAPALKVKKGYGTSKPDDDLAAADVYVTTPAASVPKCIRQDGGVPGMIKRL